MIRIIAKILIQTGEIGFITKIINLAPTFNYGR